MPQQIKVDITIDKKIISPFSYLSLNQSINNHHEFELRFNNDVLEEIDSISIDKSKELLGKQITITFNTLKVSGKDHVFNGIVTNVGISNSITNPGDLVFKGFSSSILLETGENNNSYLESTLKEILEKTYDGIADNLLIKNSSPNKKTKLPYTVQYRESNFNFIRRLAAEFGEWFFYDGTNLIFGVPSQKDTIDLQYPNDITDFNLEMKVAPLAFEQIGYISKDNLNVKNDSKSQQITGLDTFGKFALSVSEKLFPKNTTTLTKRNFEEPKELDESIKTAKNNIASDLVVLYATSDSPFVKLGTQIQLTANNINKENIVEYGKFTVISVTHQTDGIGNYSNTFEAIPSTITIPPSNYYNKPNAEPQIGIVKKFDDDLGIGRVKVQLFWQKENETTPWIHVMTPTWGLADDSKKSRGMLFIPEIGDYVIVGFKQNDPDMPYVMGSIPNGNTINKRGQKNIAQNVTKRISVRTGAYFAFNDDEENNIVSLGVDFDNQLKKPTIALQFKEKKGLVVMFSDNEITIDSKNKIEIKSKNSIDIHSGGTINIKSDKITIDASDSIKMNATKKIEIKSAEINIEASNKINAKAGTDMKLEALNIEAEASVNAKVKAGAQLGLEGGAMTAIKGAIVTIN